ncbi:protein serine/threonine phosphatase 2C [Tilletiaria anomala UBC 951]|uniref:Protein serine/threonine phosphatase 2C n=1 Tax=Tilletiaria anomala (strain ATCC 24038 / CBS 436.72 / UBC 951) TaxID=1037660 RepID=A0A066WFN1_TILAU|nr:protein serine/threonine phosphatase 2C [Tilletiaria anomala UBC 951]KDN52782.1 protein serine/threonine phosphatase 2C [Tilletiaria anomala UBC 951]
MNVGAATAGRPLWMPPRTQPRWTQLSSPARCDTCRSSAASNPARNHFYDKGPSCSYRLLQARGYRDYIRSQTLDNTTGKSRTARIPLKNGSVFGLSATRGTRVYQEDASSVLCVQLPSGDLKESLAQSRSRVAQQAAVRWDAEKAGGEDLAGQVLWIGCFDGHGGQAISGFLRSFLHDIFERVQPDMVTDTVQYTRSHGGYFRRFTGGLLERWVRQDQLRSVRSGGPGGAAATSRAKGAGTRPTASMSNDAMARKEVDPPGPRTLSDLAATLSPGARYKQPNVVHSGDDVGETNNDRPIESPHMQTVSSPSDSFSKTGETERQPPESDAKQIRNKGDAVCGVDTQSGSSPLSPFSVETPPSASQSDVTKGLDKPLADGQMPDLLAKPIEPPEELEGQHLTLAERATLAWLVADRMIQADKGRLDIGGSTASVALIYSLDTPAVPWYSSKLVSITTAHVGDTRMLLCATEDGRAIPLTNYHHPDDRAEAVRLRKLGAGMITDSFGELRWMGALANTRAFGDSRYKKVGVTVEPEVISQIIKGDEYAFLIAFSDGVGGVMSDQEIVDLCRGADHPSDAAKAVLSFAEELGTEDNCTVVCVPLRGWGKVKGEDATQQRREYRRSKVDIFRDSRK